MNNELNRIQSYKDFPEYCPVSPILLASDGFYYTGTVGKSICFCCGLEIDTTNINETVFQIHRRLSPDCRFVTGRDNTNKPINRETSVHNSAEDEHIETDHHFITVMESGRMPEESSQPPGGAEGSVRDESKSLLCVSGMRTDRRNPIARNQNSFQRNGQIELYPGITYEKPKNPDYAVKSVRLSSFTNWRHGVMDPGQMAEAGFYYTGVHDNVRCFFCGGGMKDWQAGDNAWMEHARWFPNCAYVKQCKGEDFINMCRMANIEYLTNGGAQTQVPECWSLERHEKHVDEQQIEDLNCTAAKLVLDMGYGQGDVENAIKFAREKYGNAELRAQYILEFLLDNAYVKKETSTGSNHRVTSSNDKEHKSSSSSACASLQKEGEKAETLGEINEGEQQFLLEENRQLKERMTCKICMDKDACIVFLPCGHMVSCMECAPALRKCAVCRTIIHGTVRAYPG